MSKIGAAIAAASRPEIIVAAGAAAVVVGAGAVVGPRMLLGEPASEPSLVFSDHVTAVEQEVAERIKELLESCRGVLHVAESTENPAIALWKDDARDRGTINRDEVLILAHNRVMHALEAHEASSDSDSDAPSPAVRYENLFSDHLSDIWRALPDASTHVIATSVSAMHFRTTPGGDGQATLEVRLTWDQATSDEPHEAMFSVDLPTVERGGRGM